MRIMTDIRDGAIKINRECVHVVFLGLPNVPGVAAGIFNALSERDISVEMITQNTMRGGRADLSFLIRRDRLDEVIPLCREVSERAGAQGVSFATEIAAIAVPVSPGGSGPSGAPQTLAKVFSALAGAGVNVEIINSSPESVICIVSLIHAEEGLRALREAFAPAP